MKLSHRKKRLSKHGLWWPMQRQTVSFEARMLRQAWIANQPQTCIIHGVTRHSVSNRFKMALARMSVFLSRFTTKSEKNT
ncbi:hypothetical protein [Salinivibrio socompensis]|uniref:hypothetical protein n=1 Tax=Salinivibrio socompensis TaxID=1510206 RepID=UPI0004724688|nr:hypothetical protein [Salinivibrio socompensis]